MAARKPCQERIALTLCCCAYVRQVWVYGSSHRRSLVAVVVPRREELLRLLGRAGQVAITPPYPPPPPLPSAAGAVAAGGVGRRGGGVGDELEGCYKGGAGGEGEGVLEEARGVAQVSAVPEPVGGGAAEAGRAAGALAAKPAGAGAGAGTLPTGAGGGGGGDEGDRASTLVSSLCVLPQVAQQVLKALQVGGAACGTHVSPGPSGGQAVRPRSCPMASAACGATKGNTWHVVLVLVLVLLQAAAGGASYRYPRRTLARHAPVQQHPSRTSRSATDNPHRRRWAAPTVSRALSWCTPCTWFRSPSAPAMA